MRVNKNGFVARHALRENPFLHDECSLFRAFSVAMFKRFFFNVLLPSWVLIAVILYVAGAFFDGMDWLIAKSDDQLVSTVIASFHWVWQIVFFVPAMMIVAISHVVIVFGAILALLFALGKVAKISVTKTVEATPLNVVVTGIKNKWQGICRPVEFYEE